jgi:hypothetical protein
MRFHVARQDRHEDAAGGQRSRSSAYQAFALAHVIPAGHRTMITTPITICGGREKRFFGDSLEKDVARPLLARG